MTAPRLTEAELAELLVYYARIMLGRTPERLPAHYGDDVSIIVNAAPRLIAAARLANKQAERIAELETALAKAGEELEQYRGAQRRLNWHTRP